MMNQSPAKWGCKGLWSRIWLTSLLALLSLVGTPALALTTTTTVVTSSVNPTYVSQSTTLTATVTPSTATGTVTFKDGTTTLGTGTLASGVATLATSFTATGSHSLTAVYGGNSSDATSTSAAVAQTVNAKVTTTTAITVAPNPVTVGQTTTITATVTGSSPTGNVQFLSGGTAVMATVPLSSGKAVFVLTAPQAGTASLSAAYVGDTVNAASTSATTVLTMNAASTTTALTSSVNPVAAGLSTTLTATVTPSAATGTVTFKDGTTTLGTGTLSGGVATLTTSFTSTGTHSLTAAYATNGNYLSSTSAAVSQTVSVRSTSTVIVVTPSPATVGQLVTITATITGSSPTGNVEFFYAGTGVLGTVPVSAGKAVFTYTAPYAQTISLSATYQGDSANSTSTSSSFSLVTNEASTTVALTSSVNPVPAGLNTTLTATVTPSAATGTVTFKDGTTTLGTGTLSAGVATLATSFAATGAHSLTAVYASDGNYQSSTSAALSQTVNLRPTTTAIVVTPSPGTVGQVETVTATVTGTNPTGNVQFLLNSSTVMTTAPLSGGTAVFTYTVPNAETINLSAAYQGDSANATSTSSTFALTTNAATTTTALTSSVNPVVVGASATLTATITSSLATGTVTFNDGTTVLGTATISSGVATLTTKFTATGAHSLTAIYGGSNNYLTSTSTALSETVNLPPAAATTTTLTSSANPSNVGASLTLAATVTGNSPTQTVQFKDGATNLGSAVTLLNGQASTTVTPGAAGGHVYSAVYSGDTNNATSTGQVSVNIIGGVSTTALTASANSATPTTAVTFTAAIVGSSPTGSVIFRDGATTLQTVTLASGTATASQTFVTGLHSVTASYAGDSTNAPSASTAVLVQVSAGGTTPPAGAALQLNYQYDAQGNLTQVVDANAATTQQAYDSLYRNTQITQPVPAAGASAPTIGLAYDLQDQPASVTDPRTLTTSYTTDGLGNTTVQASPDTGTTTQTYYDSGLLHTTQDARGRLATYAYDALDRPTTITYDAGVGTTFTYDETAGGNYGLGHLTTIVDETGTTHFVYDGLGRVVTKTQTTGPSSKVFTLTYTWGTTGTANGKLQTVRYPSGASVTYGYDTAGRINDVSVTGANGIVTKVLTGLSYNALSQPLSWVWGTGGVPYQRSFDGYGRLTSYPLGNPAGTGVAAGVVRTLAFDAAGRIVGYSHTTQVNWDQTFAYDGLDRLTGATLNGGNTYGYAYDPTGNRTQATINGTAYALTVNAASNQYTNVATAQGATNAQGFDAAGHLTSEGQGGTYTYTSRGRMSTELRSGNTFSYLYNALEQRTYKTGPTSVITTGASYYVYDEAGHVVGEYDATGKAVYETVYMGNMPVAALTQPAIGQTTVSYVYADHLNTARVIVRPTDQAIVWSWGSNEPFGQTQASPNPNGLGAYTYNPRFPGQVADVESGWLYNWHRDYNPALGRYTESDPIGLDGGINTFGYVGADPLTGFDPNGLQIVIVNRPGPAGGYSPMPGAGSTANSMVNDGPGRGRERETAAQARSRESNCPTPSDEECKKERLEAENNCFEWIQELKSSRTPAGRKRDLLKLTGGSMSVCVPGQVSQACGGNKVR